MDRQSYNGWANHATWCVNLWLENDEPYYRYWRRAAQDARSEAEETDDLECAVHLLADRMKEEISESAPPVTGVWADLMASAMADVDWHEIATAWLEGL